MKRAMSVFTAAVTVAGLCGCGKANKPAQKTTNQPKVSEAKNWEPETAEQPKVSNATSTAPETAEQPKTSNATGQETEMAKQPEPKNDAGAPPKFQTDCPVDGGQPRRDFAADQEGLRVFLCSTKCLQEFGENPGKYISKLQEQGFTVAKIQTTCPVTGNAVDRSAYADIAGMRVYLCSADCAGTLKRDPGKYLKKQMMAGVIHDPAPQSSHAGHNHGPGGHAPH